VVVSRWVELDEDTSAMDVPGGCLVRCQIFYDPDKRDPGSDVKVAVSVCYVPGVALSEPREGSPIVLLPARSNH
jgi:hypothetical protein